MLHTFTKKGKLEPPVFNTSADRNEGILDLYNGMNELLKVMVKEGILIQKQLDRHRNRVYNIIQDRLLKKLWTQERLDHLEISINHLDTTQTSPHEVATSLLKKAHE